MLRAQHFVAIPSLLLRNLSCNLNTQEKRGIIEKST
jgi:hypothetical protein